MADQGWDIENVLCTPDGQQLLWTTNENGFSCVYCRYLPSGKTRRIFESVDAVIRQIEVSHNSCLVAATIDCIDAPVQLYLADLSTQEYEPLTTLGGGSGVPMRLLTPGIARHDGSVIPAYLYLPKSCAEREAFPLILALHGGPHEQERPSNNPFYQLLVRHGIAVLAPNVRGSSGYGRKHQEILYGNWGGPDLEDIGICLAWVSDQTWFKQERVGIVGISYGGFLALSALGRLTIPWACGISWAGPTDLDAFVRGMPSVVRSILYRTVGNPTDDGGQLIDRSPVAYAKSFEMPLLVIQGALDQRVRLEDTNRFINVLRTNGAPVEYLVLPNEGHGITRQENLEYVMETAFDFLRRHLLER